MYPKENQNEPKYKQGNQKIATIKLNVQLGLQGCAKIMRKL